MANINNLPVEVLDHIFSDLTLSLEDSDFPVMKKRHGASLKPISKIAYQVCRHWRSIIRNNPGFYFMCFTFSDVDEGIEMKAMKKLISRYQGWANSSPSADIDVIVILRQFYSHWNFGIPVVADRSEIVGRLVDFLVSIAHRWRLFSFEAKQVSDYDLLNKALNIRAARGGTVLARLITVNLKAGDGLGTPVDSLAKYIAPNMETFQSRNVPTDKEHVLTFTRAASTVNIFRSGLPYRKFAMHLLNNLPYLVNLTLGSDHICYEKSMVREPGLAEFGWQSLQRLTFLEHFLGSHEGAQTPGQWPRELPNVTFVQMIGVSLSGVKLFLSSFALPSLQTLVLQHMRHINLMDLGSYIWRKADDAYPKTITLLEIRPKILDFVLRNLARSAEEIVIEGVTEIHEPIDHDMTWVPLPNLRKLSLKRVPWNWVTCRELQVSRSRTLQVAT